MVREKEIFLKNILQIIDLVVVSVSFGVTFYVMGIVRNRFNLGKMAFAPNFDLQGALFFFENNFIIFLSAIFFWLIFLNFFGVYHDFRTENYLKIFFGIIKSAIASTLAIGSVVFLLKMTETSRLFVGLFSCICAILLVIEKRVFIIFLEYVRTRGYNRVNILIVGTGKRAQKFIDVVNNHKHWGLNIIGLIDDEPGRTGTYIMGSKVLGRLSDIPRLLHTYVVDRVVFVVPRSWLGNIEDAILACEKEGVETYLSVDLYDTKISSLKQTNFGGFPLLEFETFSANEWQLFVKRTTDILVSLTGIIIAMPFFIVLALAIKLSSKGPIYFKQERSGLNGRKFTLYKFRTMMVGAELRKKELEKQNEMQGPVFKIKRDPRVYPLGRLLRKISLDELPQLLNVLKGDMSIVGPRPPLPIEVEMYEIWQRRRLSLKPGITCIWQVSGRNMVDFDRWMEMDLEYIDNWSLWLDVKISLKTVLVVLFGYGAY
ncbi:sugar transferase [candidate division KSB1 bacterium]|nr:sugar transferase [candidate division KSB1 bacterium]